MGAGVSRRKGCRACRVCRCFAQFTQLGQGNRQVLVRFRITGIALRGTLQGLDCRRRVAERQQGVPEIDQGVRIVRLQRQISSIYLRGLVEVAKLEPRVAQGELRSPNQGPGGVGALGAVTMVCLRGHSDRPRHDGDGIPDARSR